MHWSDWLYYSLMALILIWAPFAGLLAERAQRARMEGWRAVAATLGLREITTDRVWRLSGRAGRQRVHFEMFAKTERKYVTRVRVAGSSGLTLRPESSAPPPGSSSDVREIELGDDAFDAEVHVQGAPERVRALLDAETRGIVRRMLDGRLEVPGRRPVRISGKVTLVDGDLCADFGPKPTVEELNSAIPPLLAIAERFERPARVPERLATVLEQEPHWGVRLRGLQLLTLSYPNDPATLAALRRGLADEHAAVRVQAAIPLRVEGLPTLLEVACREGDDATAARAIDHLGNRFPAEAIESVLRQALRTRRLDTASACIRALARVGGPAAGPLLAKVVSLENGQLAVAAVHALRSSGAPEAEQAMLTALERGLAELTIPAIEALGHLGSASAVLPIKDAAETTGSSAEVRRAARQAVAEIQSRLLGASPGQVSIAESEAGHLSLADDDPRGRVSLPAGS